MFIGVAPKKTYVCKELRALNAKSLYANKESSGVSSQEVSDMIVALRQKKLCNDKDFKAEIPHCHPQKDPSCLTLLSVLEYSNRAAMLGTTLQGY